MAQQLKNIEEIKLSKYYVIFLDFLGMTDLINSNKSELILKDIFKVYNETLYLLNSNIENNLYCYDMKFKIFSDNMIIAIPIDCELGYEMNNQIKTLFITNFAAFIQIIALKYNLLLRGAIVADDLYIDEVFVYGKALTKAYDLESNIAIYPRIVIDSKDIGLFNTSDKQSKYIKADEANIAYINPFICYEYYAPDKDWQQIINTTLKELLKTKYNNKVQQKINWFINMYNEYCNLNSENYKYKITLK